MEFEISPAARARYVERRKKDLETLTLALEQSDFSSMQDIAHQLKGNGVTFGFAELSEHAIQLEVFAKAADLGGAQKEVTWFAGWLQEQLRQL